MREHYEIEKELAQRLRRASKLERRRLYPSLYDELYRRVPLHPQLSRRRSPADTARAVEWQLRFLKPLLDENSVFLEVGAGDCALACEVSKHVKQVYAVDVSDEITKELSAPANFQLLLSDGCSIPVPRNSVSVAYSNQLMEHLHPDDAYEQLQNIYDVLVPGGAYACITPNRLTGPHDVSSYFDSVATGFHLKEYTIQELRKLFTDVGFSRVRAYVGARGHYRSFPAPVLISCERLLSWLPSAARKAITRRLPLGALLNVRLVGIK